MIYSAFTLSISVAGKEIVCYFLNSEKFRIAAAMAAVLDSFWFLVSLWVGEVQSGRTKVRQAFAGRNHLHHRRLLLLSPKGSRRDHSIPGRGVHRRILVEKYLAAPGAYRGRYRSHRKAPSGAGEGSSSRYRTGVLRAIRAAVPAAALVMKRGKGGRLPSISIYSAAVFGH